MATILACTRKDDMLPELGSLLRSEHRVAIVPHVADVVRSLLLTRVDTVVLDIDAGLLQDIDLLPVIARLNPHIPILAISTPDAKEVEAAVQAVGVFRFLHRPLASGELERHLVAALRWRAAAATLLASARHGDAAEPIER